MNRKAMHNQKGDAFEAMVSAYYESQGYTAYGPENPNKRHPCDFYFLRERDGKSFWMDAKAYAATVRDGFLITGVNQRHYDEYCQMARVRKDPMWLIFGDHVHGRTYGQSIAELQKYLIEKSVINRGRHFPWLWSCGTGSKIMWPLSRFVELFALTDEQRALLKSLTKEQTWKQEDFLAV